MRGGQTLLFILSFVLVSLALGSDFSISKREEVREMFFHAFDHYMDHAFPDDELKPLSCSGRRRNGQNLRGEMDNTLGDYALTLVDAMDSLVVLGDYQEFEKAVYHVIEQVSFNRDVTVNLFEVNIRILGGLLSAHQLATHLQHESYESNSNLYNYQIQLSKELEQLPSLTWHQKRIIQQVDAHITFFPNYNNELLDLAYDLGQRLLPAFDTPTGIPYSLINLQTGPIRLRSTCLAGAGTLSMEFITLSKLTKDERFQKIVLKALEKLCSLQSQLGLFGGIVYVDNGAVGDLVASIGAGSDSFYEYLLKSWLLTGNDVMKQCFDNAYEAVNEYMFQNDFYLPVDYRRGTILRYTVDSLQAFWPGLQVSIGEISKAIRGHYKFWVLWDTYKFIPERFDIYRRKVTFDDYPLRPEFIESSYFLYKATAHPFYLKVGERVVNNLQTYSRVECGFASVGVKDFRLDDRMDSFFLSETLKYLYLLFENDHWIDNHYIFTTEAHLIEHEYSSVEYQISDVDNSLIDSFFAKYFGENEPSFSDWEDDNHFDEVEMNPMGTPEVVVTEGYWLIDIFLPEHQLASFVHSDPPHLIYELLEEQCYDMFTFESPKKKQESLAGSFVFFSPLPQISLDSQLEELISYGVSAILLEKMDGETLEMNFLIPIAFLSSDDALLLLNYSIEGEPLHIQNTKKNVAPQVFVTIPEGHFDNPSFTSFIGALQALINENQHAKKSSLSKTIQQFLSREEEAKIEPGTSFLFEEEEGEMEEFYCADGYCIDE